MHTRLAALLLLLGAASAHAQEASKPSLFTRQDAVWAAAIFAGSVALSRADVHIIRVWTDSSNHDPGRDQIARNFANGRSRDGNGQEHEFLQRRCG